MKPVHTQSPFAGLTSVHALCRLVGKSRQEYEQATRESRHNYIQHRHIDKVTGKRRDLCYPPEDSTLRAFQASIKDALLTKIEISPEVRGYRRGSHNIGVAAEISGAPYEGRVDISKFHPSINKRHVAVALQKHGVSWPTARRIARLVTFRDQVPQGAPTSSHVANIVLDSLLRRDVLPFAAERRAIVRNYGDDIAFVGANAHDVAACVKRAKRAIRSQGLKVNEAKSCNCEHRGGKRQFIGCATGRGKPDYPRAKYRSLRKELRERLYSLRSGRVSPHSLGDRRINSLRQRIAYVGRLNPRKARRLRDVFYRICAETRRAGVAAN